MPTTLIAKALHLIKQRPDRTEAAWPQEAKEQVRQAQTLLDEHHDRPEGFIPDYVAEARWLSGQGVEQLKFQPFKEAARDPAAAAMFFKQQERPEWSRTGTPLDKPLDLKKDDLAKHAQLDEDTRRTRAGQLLLSARGALNVASREHNLSPDAAQARSSIDEALRIVQPHPDQAENTSLTEAIKVY